MPSAAAFEIATCKAARAAADAEDYARAADLWEQADRLRKAAGTAQALKAKPKRKTVRAVWEAGSVTPDETPATGDAVTNVRSQQPRYEGDDEPGPTDPIEALRRRLAPHKRTRKSMTKITKQLALDQDVGAVVKAAQIHYERGWTDLDPSAPLPVVRKARATGEAVAPAIATARASDPGRIEKARSSGTSRFGNSGMSLAAVVQQRFQEPV